MKIRRPKAAFDIGDYVRVKKTGRTGYVVPFGVVPGSPKGFVTIRDDKTREAVAVCPTTLRKANEPGVNG